MTNRCYPIVIEELSAEDGGGFIAYVPDLYGCKSDGETREEAVTNVQGAICEWTDEMLRLGRDIPEPGSAKKQAHQAIKDVEDVVARAAEALRRSTDTMTRMRADHEALQREFEALVRRSEEQASWAMLPMVQPRLAGTDLPH